MQPILLQVQGKQKINNFYFCLLREREENGDFLESTKTRIADCELPAGLSLARQDLRVLCNNRERPLPSFIADFWCNK